MEAEDAAPWTLSAETAGRLIPPVWILRSRLLPPPLVLSSTAVCVLLKQVSCGGLSVAISAGRTRGAEGESALQRQGGGQQTYQAVLEQGITHGT